MIPPLVSAPRTMIERKRAHGAPCNSYGLCCHGSLCKLAQHIFRREAFPGPCPALRDNGDGTHSCDVVHTPQRYAGNLSISLRIDTLRHAALLLIGGGYGCDARINGEPRNIAFDRKLEAWDVAKAEKLKVARRIWGLSN